MFDMLKLFGCTGDLMSVWFNWDNWSKVCIFKWQASQFHHLQWQRWFNMRKETVWLWLLNWDHVKRMDMIAHLQLTLPRSKMTAQAILGLKWIKANQCWYRPIILTLCGLGRLKRWWRWFREKAIMFNQSQTSYFPSYLPGLGPTDRSNGGGEPEINYITSSSLP